MKELFSRAFARRRIRILEIGVWYGVGSTDIWLSNCQAGSEIYLADSWAPYASEGDLNDHEWNWKKVDDLSTDAFLSAYLNTKRLQEERQADNIKIHLTRGNASTFLPVLGSDLFDFIYIDGDHKYENIKLDIREAKRLVKKDFGIICGDDLEVMPTPELYELAKQHPKLDYLRDPHNFHPGVLAAIHEEFETVNMVNGFWWTFCVDGDFTIGAITPDRLQPKP